MPADLNNRVRIRSVGFSLLELLAVIATITILLVAAVPVFSITSNSARQASREIIKGHLQQARAHAISSGTPTALAIPVLGAPEELGARALSLVEVNKTGSAYTPLLDAQGTQRLLQGWERLPGNFHFLSNAQIPGSKATIVDAPERLQTDYRNRPVSCHLIVFAPNGQIVHPPSGTVLLIAIAQAVKRGGSLTLTQKNQGQPVFDLLVVNRLTGRTRFAQP